jgi:mannose-6-phosphate isomerase-like protein (cupin superfamily)
VRRLTRNLVGGVAPIACENFCLGYVVLEPGGRQVPWHNQAQEEVYFIVSEMGEMCLGDEKLTVQTGQ